MKLILFSILINFFYSQANYEVIASTLIERSVKYFSQKVSTDSVIKPYSIDVLENFNDDYEEGFFDNISIQDNVYLNYFLFRYFKEAIHPLTLDVGLRAYNLSQKVKNRSMELSFIEGEIQYYSSNIGTWQKITNLFNKLYGNKSEATKKLLVQLPKFSPLYTISLEKQYDINLNDNFDYLLSKKILEKLLVKFPSSEKILTKYMNLVFDAGFFEDALSALNPLLYSNTLSGDHSHLIQSIAKCYYYLSQFDISAQYFYQVKAKDTLQLVDETSLYIVKIKYLTNVLDSVSLDSTLYYFEEYSLNDEYDRLEEFISKYDNSILKELHKLEFKLNKKDFSEVKERLTALESYSSSSAKIHKRYMILFAKLLWQEKDFFNAKRYLHNLKNTYEDNLPNDIKCTTHLILADISYRANDFEQSKSYLDEVKLEDLPFYERHIFHYLSSSLEK